MSEDRAVTFANESDRKRDLRRRKVAEVKHRIYMFGHKILWLTLHRTWLARPYSKTMCRLRLYSKFPDGRCQWCGINHTDAEHASESKK